MKVKKVWKEVNEGIRKRGQSENINKRKNKEGRGRKRKEDCSEYHRVFHSGQAAKDCSLPLTSIGTEVKKTRV
jgi:hypothetical protein